MTCAWSNEMVFCHQWCQTWAIFSINTRSEQDSHPIFQDFFGSYTDVVMMNNGKKLCEDCLKCLLLCSMEECKSWFQNVSKLWEIFGWFSSQFTSLIWFILSAPPKSDPVATKAITSGIQRKEMEDKNTASQKQKVSARNLINFIQLWIIFIQISRMQV